MDRLSNTAQTFPTEMETSRRQRPKRRGTSPIRWIGILALAVVVFWSVFDWALAFFHFEEISDHIDQKAGVGREHELEPLVFPPSAVGEVRVLAHDGWTVDGTPVSTRIGLSSALVARRGDDGGLRIANLPNSDDVHDELIHETAVLCVDAGFSPRIQGKTEWTDRGSTGREIDVARVADWTRNDDWFSNTNPAFDPWIEDLATRYALGAAMAEGSVESFRRLALHSVWTTLARRMHPLEADVLDLWLVSGELPSELPETDAGRAWSTVRREFLALMDADRRFLIEGMTPLDEVELPAFLPREPEVGIPDDSPTLEILRGADGSLGWRLGELQATSVSDLIKLLDREEIGPVFLEPGPGVTYGDVAITMDACRRAEVEPDFRREISASPNSPKPVVEDLPVINISKDGAIAYKGNTVYDLEQEPGMPIDLPSGEVRIVVSDPAKAYEKLERAMQGEDAPPKGAPLTNAQLRKIAEFLRPLW